MTSGPGCASAPPRTGRPLSAGADPLPAVELHFRVKKQEPQGDDPAADALAEVADLEEARKEARLVALRFHHRSEPPAIPFGTRPPAASARWRGATWPCCCALRPTKPKVMRRNSPGSKSPYRSPAAVSIKAPRSPISWACLQLLDNPLQDVPLLAVLHSPLVGMTLDELAAIRLAVKGPFWTALVRWEQSTAHGPELKVESPEAAVGNPKAPLEGQQMDLPPGHGTAGKVSRFLERYARMAAAGTPGIARSLS